MMDKQKDGSSEVIDDFVVVLSYCHNDQIISYTGKNKIAIINVSYEIHCINFEDCTEVTSPLSCGSQLPALVTPVTTPDCSYVHNNLVY